MQHNVEVNTTIHLFTNDIEKTRTFYESLLDLDLDYRLNLSKPIDEFDFYFGGVHFDFSITEEKVTPKNIRFSVYFEDIKSADGHLKKIGANILKPLHYDTVFEKIIFADPNGYEFELYREVM